jgi:hypothetical protein
MWLLDTFVKSKNVQKNVSSVKWRVGELAAEDPRKKKEEIVIIFLRSHHTLNVEKQEIVWGRQWRTIESRM